MSDDEGPVVKKPVRKVVVDDDDAPVVKKPAAKKPVVAEDDDDDAPVVKKPQAKAATATTDDGPVVKKPAPKRPPQSDSDSDDDRPVTGKPTAKVHLDPVRGLDSDEDTDDEGSEDSEDRELVDLINYDDMTEDDFVQHLLSQTKADRLEEKRLVEENKAVEVTSSNDDRHFDGTPAFSYTYMLDRILAICRQNNPELAQTERIRLPMPKVERYGSKKTVLINFKELCVALNRTQEEVKDYIEKALTTQGSIDGNHNLLLKYQNAKVSQFEKLVAKYVDEYVKCRACGRINTKLTKDQSSRLLLMHCNDCSAQRYIQVAGGATFKAQVGKRAKARNAMT